MNQVQFKMDSVVSPFHYDVASLTEAWGRIHSIDQEPLPSESGFKQLLKATNLELTSPMFGDDFAGLTAALLDAWVDFHNGHFQQAYAKGQACGPIGSYVALLALNSYSTYLAPAEEQAELFWQAAEAAKQSAVHFPRVVNMEYVYALNLGRYTETVSIGKAIGSGAALNFKKSLDTCLQINPGHIPSLLAQGALFAQAIDAVGELAARMSFGATKKKVFAAYENALQGDNPPPVVFLEYAKNLQLLERKQQAKVGQLLKQALAAPVLDPLDYFDQQEAAELLEQL